MTLDLMILIAQAAMVFFLAAWLTTGVFENLFLPEINSPFTAEVLAMTRMKQDYPDAYALVSYRRITNPTLQEALFRLIVVWELGATIALWVGAGALLLAILGHTGVDSARAFGLLGALMFTATWAAFLIVGNWFCYWFCHEGAQNTHYQMTLWGLGVVLLLALS